MKWHRILEDTIQGKIISGICTLIEAAEDSWIETGIEEITVDPESMTVYLPGELVGRDVVEKLQKKYEEKKVLFEYGEGPLHYRDLYTYLKEKTASLLSTYITELLERTYSLGKEHALLLLPDGKIVLLEGERGKISLPEIKACVFLHTHPSYLCLPSKTDVRQAASFFMNGGYINIIVSRRCMFSFYKTWMLGEEDILALRELEGKIEKIYKTSRNPLVEIQRFLDKSYIRASFMAI